MALFDGLPKIVKLLLQFFFGYIISGVYRIVKGVKEGSVFVIVMGVLALFTGVGNAIFWVIDFITILLSDDITFLA